MKKKITINEVLNIFKKYGDLNINVNTPYGYKKIENCDITEKNGEIFKIKTENGLFLECSKNHRVKLKNGTFITIKELEIGSIIQTKNGLSKVVINESINIKEDLLDIQVRDVEQYFSNGIVSHNSTISVSLLMFLFFNKTDKTKTNLEIFNVYTDKNDVKVKGYIEIDGDDYIIERTVNRKMSKAGEFNVKSELNFYKKLGDELINLSGEQRRETENIITSAIGTEEDFLLTILSTGNNLEDLIDSKPTARGQILTRFLGLELLKLKEEISKSKHNEWSKNLVSNTENITSLENNNIENDKNIVIFENEIIELTKSLVLIDKELKELEDKRDHLLGNRNNDIDKELLTINVDYLASEIKKLISEQTNLKEQIGLINLVDPSKYYVEEDHELVRKNINLNNISRGNKKTEIDGKNRLNKDLEQSKFCPTCKQSLLDVDHTSEIEVIKKEITQFNVELGLLTEEHEKLTKTADEFDSLKKEYDIYEKDKLRLLKYELECGQKQLSMDINNGKIDNFNKNKKKLELNQKIDSELAGLRTKIETEKGNIRIINSNIDKKKHDITGLNVKIKNNLELIKKIRQEEEFGATFKIYLSIFGKNGISKVIIKNMIPLLNTELHRLMEDSCYFTLEFNINDKNELEFLMIDNETRVVKLLSTGSGYEKTISALAIRSVLTKISSLPKPNIVVMDEVLSKVADENLEMMGEFFKKVKEYFEHIFIISHNSLIRNWSDNLIMVKKEDNISSIEYITKKSS